MESTPSNRFKWSYKNLSDEMVQTADSVPKKLDCLDNHFLNHKHFKNVCELKIYGC